MICCHCAAMPGKPNSSVRTSNAMAASLGAAAKIDWVEIRWPSGQVDRLTNVPIDQIIAVKEGSGIVPRKFPRIVPKAAEKVTDTK